MCFHICNITRFAFSPFVFYSVFKVHFLQAFAFCGFLALSAAVHDRTVVLGSSLTSLPAAFLQVPKKLWFSILPRSTTALWFLALR